MHSPMCSVYLPMLTPLPQSKEAKDDERRTEGHTRGCGSRARARGGCACKLRRWREFEWRAWRRIFLWWRREVRLLFVRSHYDDQGCLLEERLLEERLLEGCLGWDAQDHHHQGDRVQAFPLHRHIEETRHLRLQGREQGLHPALLGDRRRGREEQRWGSGQGQAGAVLRLWTKRRAHADLPEAGHL